MFICIRLKSEGGEKDIFHNRQFKCSERKISNDKF